MNIQASVIIPTRDRPAQLKALLESFKLQEDAEALRWEIIVVDDGSARETRAAIERYLASWTGSPVRCRYFSESGGVSRARNVGVAESSGEILIFLDDDMIVDAHFLKETLRVHADHPGIRVLNGLLQKMDDDLYSSFWYYYYSSVFNRPCQGPYEVNRVAAGHFSVKRELLEEIHPLFDESLPAREDLDLFLRLRQAQVPAYKDDRIIAYHDFRRSLSSLISQRLWYERGEVMLRRKYGAETLAAFYRGEPRIPRNWRFLPLNLVLLLARRLGRLYWRFKLSQ